MNKFRGDIKLLQPALDFLEEKTGIPVVGVVPFYDEFKIPEEDSVVLEERKSETQQAKKLSTVERLDIVVIRLPYLSNFTDFDPLEDELDITLRYVKEPSELGQPDCVIVPGSKNTLADLRFLWESGLAEQVQRLWKESVPIIGICGGYQMLGRVVKDPLRTESDLEEIEGLGILPMDTEFALDKHTVQSRGKVISNELFFNRCKDTEITGYEIHMGRSFTNGTSLFEIEAHNEVYGDGLVSGSAFGTYLHGIFDNDPLRTALLEWLWERRGQKRTVENSLSQAAIREHAFNELADWVRKSVDIERIRSIMGLSKG
jgi:adenosylcobyric acid synthase